MALVLRKLTILCAVALMIALVRSDLEIEVESEDEGHGEEYDHQ